MASPNPPRVTVSVADHVADVRLNRPEKMNAIDGHMFVALAEAGATVAATKGVRAVVLSGEGRGFCAGLDIANFQAAGRGSDDIPEAVVSMARDIPARLPGKITNLAQEVAHVWSTLDAPVIAALHGPALGGGFQIAMGADIRIVAPDAKLSVLEIRWGLLPDMTGLATLPRLVGLDVAKELAFTGRMVSGVEAVGLGLATRVSDDPLGDALSLAREIAGKNPEAIRATKAILNAAGTRPLAEAYLDESRRMAEVMGSPNQLEAVMAELEGRPAAFPEG